MDVFQQSSAFNLGVFGRGRKFVNFITFDFKFFNQAVETYSNSS